MATEVAYLPGDGPIDQTRTGRRAERREVRIAMSRSNAPRRGEDPVGHADAVTTMNDLRTALSLANGAATDEVCAATGHDVRRRGGCARCARGGSHWPPVPALSKQAREVLPQVYDGATTEDTRLDAGLYPSMPQGHARLSDGTRELVVVDLGGVVDVAGIAVTSPEELRRFGEHLVMLAARLDRRAAHHSHPDAPCCAITQTT